MTARRLYAEVARIKLETTSLAFTAFSRHSTSFQLVSPPLYRHHPSASEKGTNMLLLPTCILTAVLPT